ncbi:hypothetical protein GGF31_003551 [Allomyces arbusculus]|nr:hypothetical protein GGF31_003551 [Allomyces arbusculus]
MFPPTTTSDDLIPTSMPTSTYQSPACGHQKVNPSSDTNNCDLPYLHLPGTEHAVGPHIRAPFCQAGVRNLAVKTVASFALFGGIGLLVTILLCVLVSLGYTKTQVRVGPLTWLVLVAGTFYAFLILALLRTWIRTAARLAIWIWAAQSTRPNVDAGNLTGARTPNCMNDGDSAVLRPDDETRVALHPLVFYLMNAIRRAQFIVDRCVERIVHLIDARQSHAGTATALVHDECASSSPTCWSSPLLSSTLSTQVGASVPNVSKTDLLSLSDLSFDDKDQSATHVTASVNVVSVNVHCRFVRCLSFVALMWKGSLNPDRRRAIYVASTGQDTRLNIFDSLVEQVLRTLVVTLRWFEPVVVCIVRAVALAFGLTGLALIDKTGIHDPTTPTNTSLEDVAQKWSDQHTTADSAATFGYLTAFAVCYFLMDVALLATRISHRIAALMLVVSFTGKLVFAVLVVHQHTGLLSMAVLVLTYTSFDLRDSKAFWTGGPAQNGVLFMTVRRLRCARAQAKVVIGLIVAAMALSMSIGFTVGKLRAVPVDTDHFEFRNVTQPYTFCQFKFDGRYSLVDFITLAGAMYKPTASAALTLVHQNPALQGAEIWYESPADSAVRFREFRFSSAPNVSVVAIRGTANMGEVWESVHMWSTPLFITASTYLGTFAAIWPRDVTASLVAFLARNVVFSSFLYVRGVERYVVENITKGEPGRTVYLTGHSLGGGIAQIVGSRLGMQAVTVSSPGLGKSYKNYDTSIEALAQWAINVVPSRDPICMIDEQVSGLVPMPCYQRDAPHDCHMVLVNRFVGGWDGCDRAANMSSFTM